MDFGFKDMESGVYGNVEDDEELLAELAALQQEEDNRQRRAAPDRRSPAVPAKKAAPAKGLAGLDRELAVALAEPSVDVDIDAVEDDDDLLNELAGLVGDEVTEEMPSPTGSVASSSSAKPPPPPPRTAASTGAAVDTKQVEHLRELSKAYTQLVAAAQKEGNAAKIRRQQRAVDKLTELTRKVERGQTIDPEEIPVAPPNFKAGSTVPEREAPPPPIPKTVEKASPPEPRPPPIPARSVSREAPPPPTPTATAPPVPPRSSTDSTPTTPMSDESKKRTEILSILQRRRDANVVNGKAAVAAGDKVTLEQLRALEPAAAMNYVTAAKQFDEAIAVLATAPIDEVDINDIPPSPEPYRKASVPSAAPSSAPAPPKAATAPSMGEQPATFAEALAYRQKRFEALAEKAKQDNNDRKARMNVRMAGQYKEALACYRAGRPIEDLQELPTLPDFPPLPPMNAKAGGAARRPSPAPSAPGPSVVKPPPAVGPTARSGPVGQSRNTTQLEFLLNRQKQFQQAPKSKGNMELAKKYLLDSKGFDQMIQASRAGLPVNIEKAPTPPQAITSEAALKPQVDHSSLDRDEILGTMEKALISQVRKCENAREHFTKAGDVGKVRQLEEWALASRKDLLLIREVAKQNLRLPKFHTETRSLPSIELNQQLGENVLELWIGGVRDAPMPSGYTASDASIFIKYDFPFPHEAHQTGKTKLVNGTTSPQFEETITLQINRKARQLLRVVKRSPAKFEVYQKGGFLRSDKLLGTVEWKMEAFETKATLEESVPLKDGRKAVGGLLQLRAKIREPLGDAQQVRSQQEKWLIIDA